MFHYGTDGELPPVSCVFVSVCNLLILNKLFGKFDARNRGWVIAEWGVVPFAGIALTRAQLRFERSEPCR
jgi:hypothetical protein